MKEVRIQKICEAKCKRRYSTNFNCLFELINQVLCIILLILKARLIVL